MKGTTRRRRSSKINSQVNDTVTALNEHRKIDTAVVVFITFRN